MGGNKQSEGSADRLSQRGVSLIEAVFLVALISIVALDSSQQVGNNAYVVFGTVGDALEPSSGLGTTPDPCSPNCPTN